MAKRVGYVAVVRVHDHERQIRRIRLTGTLMCVRGEYPRDRVVSEIQHKYPQGRIRKLDMWGC